MKRLGTRGMDEGEDDKEAEDDIADPNTDTVYEDVTRSVKIKVLSRSKH